MTTLLACIDFINDIVDPKGKIANSAKYIAEHDVIQHANRAIQAARNYKIPIVQVKTAFSDTYQECPKDSPLFSSLPTLGALQLNTWGSAFEKSLEVKSTDEVLIKKRVSALYGTALEPILRANKVSEVVLCGVSTNIAIETTCRELHDRDYKIVILKDACAAPSLEIHKASLSSLGLIAKILTVEEWVKSLSHRKIPV